MNIMRPIDIVLSDSASGPPHFASQRNDTPLLAVKERSFGKGLKILICEIGSKLVHLMARKLLRHCGSLYLQKRIISIR